MAFAPASEIAKTPSRGGALSAVRLKAPRPLDARAASYPARRQDASTPWAALRCGRCGATVRCGAVPCCGAAGCCGAVAAVRKVRRPSYSVTWWDGRVRSGGGVIFDRLLILRCLRQLGGTGRYRGQHLLA